jgi:mRNA-degrading endonuclease YafQ of YafQ-DinJ toxin-antitoxin module
MTKLEWDSSFRRAFKRRTRNNPGLQDRVFKALDRLAEDPFHPALKTHKLSGQLQGLWAC